uniref:S1-like domain-containing protein n=1 Tax=viral metagenome TaxID=1070528 RepID=A0A6C0D2F2_9ZZZZ
MVRNITGGNGSKGLARKDQTKGSSHIQFSTDELEKYACVTKAFGNGMVEIYTNDNVRLMGHIRNKFRGKNKRNNLITVNSLVLVGLRDYEKPPKNCDILTVYDDMQVEQMKHMPNVKIDQLLRIKLGVATGNNNNTVNDIDFAEDTETIEERPTNKKTEEPSFELTEQAQIDIDDI